MVKPINMFDMVAKANAARRSIQPGGAYAAQVKADTAKILAAWAERKGEKHAK